MNRANLTALAVRQCSAAGGLRQRGAPRAVELARSREASKAAASATAATSRRCRVGATRPHRRETDSSSSGVSPIWCSSLTQTVSDRRGCPKVEAYADFHRDGPARRFFTAGSSARLHVARQAGAHPPRRGPTHEEHLFAVSPSSAARHCWPCATGSACRGNRASRAQGQRRPPVRVPPAGSMMGAAIQPTW